MDNIGPYQILETLHRGPQPLYRVKAADGRVLAMKAAPVANATPESRERFSREAETCRTLNHPHLVRVVEAGEADGMLYQVMEMLEGADLGKIMGEGRAFSWDQKLSIMEQVCDGLQYAHEHRLVHRDIKPANLFLENSGRAVVLDFGMVRVAESELTKVGATVGTVNYMAPEQVRGERCTAASDVFSAGIVFFQLATGRHPFSTKDRSLAQIVSAIVFEEPPKLSEICPDAPEGLEFLLNRALEKDPARRLQNAGELKQSLVVCRLAMAHGVAAPRREAASAGHGGRVAGPGFADGEKTKVFGAAQAAPAGGEVLAAPKSVPAEGEKTKVFGATKPVPVEGGVFSPAKAAPGPGEISAAAKAVQAEGGASAAAKAGPAEAGVSAGAREARTTGEVVAAGKAVPAEGEKTQVFRRPAVSPMAAPPKAAPPPPSPVATPPPPPSATGLRFRYCPSCTSANPPDATVCSRCGLPLAEGAAAKNSTNWGMYIAIAIAAVLAMALIVVLVVKR